MTMNIWQELGYVEVDTSVLSRVLQGKRLFTTKQLSAFCKLLKIEHEEQELLFACLAKDLLQREGLTKKTFVMPPKHLANLFHHQLSLLQFVFKKDKQKFDQEKSSFLSQFYALAKQQPIEAL